MPQIRAFETWFVTPGAVHEVVSPAYDSLSPAERHEYGLAHPRNYLNAMRSVGEYPAGHRPSLDEVLEGNRSRLYALLDSGAFERSGSACLYLYRMAVDGHEQTGLVAEIPIAEYDDGRLRKHEHTQRDQEDALTRYNDVVGASSSPVCVAYEQDDGIDALIYAQTRNTPLVDFESEDGVRHIVWRISDARTIKKLESGFGAIEVTYLTDGHHRAASGSRFAEARRASNPEHTGEEDYNFLLVALFAHDQLRILSYNRVVADPNDHDAGALLEAVGEHFEVESLQVACAEQAAPRRKHEWSMLVNDGWYRVSVRPGSVHEEDPVRSLDVSILQEQLLGPLLGITDPRGDTRLRYVPGAVDLAGLQGLCESDGGTAFAIYPTSIEELMAVADAGAVMPPKSTWFDPKVRSGLFLLLR